VPKSACAIGSRIEAAKNYGVDLTLLIEQLRLTPAERARKLEDAAAEPAKYRSPAVSPKVSSRRWKISLTYFSAQRRAVCPLSPQETFG
jgi:hypothetical protein